MKAWRDSASLILAARHGQKYSRMVAATTHNYNLLCLIRHRDSKFLPGSGVFPGGTVDPADADVKWRKLFAALGFNGGSLASLSPQVATRPQIFHSPPNELPRDISLRITAIRETFEESGVLLCRHKRDNNDAEISSWAHCVTMPKDELVMWQSKVHDNAEVFLELCEKLQCCPDLWALHEWSNWLTPTIISTRHNTVFYLACMSFKPNVKYETSEMEGLKWDTPENLMADAIKLHLPQKYLITDLIKTKNIDNVLNNAMERNKEGVQLYMPTYIQLKDGIILLLPGDTMYPKEVNLLEMQIIDKTDITIAEHREMTPIRNRIELGETEIKVIVSDNLSTKGMQDRADMKNKL